MFDEMREKFFPNHVLDSVDAIEKQMVYALSALENNPDVVKGNTVGLIHTFFMSVRNKIEKELLPSHYRKPDRFGSISILHF